jgi:magnesium chelatase subunit D
MKNQFPWSAVLGQERLKLALLLCAIDPGIGGVLVRGPRGVAKTTLARAFSELLPGQFVELPLGATEERVTGTLDLGKVLQRGQVEFAPGLLARAHQGVLYVDEVNLLPDPLVDLLLDAAATGSNVVERDGVSHAHPARFVLVGTMNPEEGELRAQFVDRFGLSVSADSALSPPERAQIVLRRLEFESAPERFLARFAAEQQALRERCARARHSAAGLGFAGPGLDRVAEICHAARVEGVRADLAMLRAARAHAVWHGRETIELEDVTAVAELALAHRRREAPQPPPGQPPPRSAGAGAGSASGAAPGGSSGPSGTAPAAPGGSSGSGGGPLPSASLSAAASGTSGALPPVPVRGRPVVLPASWASLTGRDERRSLVPLQRRTLGPRLVQRSRLHRTLGGVDWFGTLLRCPRPTHADLRRRLRPSAAERLWILAIDCSASMLPSGALAVAKGLAAALALRAARLGDHVAVISFAGDAARVQLGPHGLERALEELGAGGGTPLRRALLEAFAVCRRPAYCGSGVEKHLLVLSDGRTREAVADLRARCRPLEPCIVDCERGALRLGRARALAAALGADYLHAEAFSSCPQALSVEPKQIAE